MLEELLPYKTYFLIAFGILIPLLIYAIYLQWGTFSQMKDSVEKEKLAMKEREEARQEDLQESIRIISMATLHEQCEISEAVIRLANLVPLCTAVDHKDEKYAALFLMYEEIKDLKTHQERTDLRAADRFQEDKIRFASEDKYHQDILKVCQNLYDQLKENIEDDRILQ